MMSDGIIAQSKSHRCSLGLQESREASVDTLKNTSLKPWTNRNETVVSHCVANFRNHVDVTSCMCVIFKNHLFFLHLLSKLVTILSN